MPEQSVSEKTTMTTHSKVEIIPANPTSEIFLNIEEIPFTAQCTKLWSKEAGRRGRLTNSKL